MNLNVDATLNVVVDTQLSSEPSRYHRHAQLSKTPRISKPRKIAEGAGRRTAADQARFYTHARGSVMEAAAALDTMRVMKLVADTTYARGMDLLEAIVAMLTKMT